MRATRLPRVARRFTHLVLLGAIAALAGCSNPTLPAVPDITGVVTGIRMSAPVSIDVRTPAADSIRNFPATNPDYSVRVGGIMLFEQTDSGFRPIALENVPVGAKAMVWTNGGDRRDILPGIPRARRVVIQATSH